MEAVDFMNSLTPNVEKKSERPRLERQLSRTELPYEPIRSVSGLRLAEVEALRNEGVEIPEMVIELDMDVSDHKNDECDVSLINTGEDSNSL